MADQANRVTFENFAKVETARMFAGITATAGGSNVWSHNRTPTPIDQQTIIRMNRDTLYSSAIIDVSQGATITIPDAGDRYFSVMLVNEDHYINQILHAAGTYELSADQLGSDFVLAAARVLVDPEDPADVAEVNALQDQLALTSHAGGQFKLMDYDEESFATTRNAVLELAKGLGGVERTFGKKGEVDPIRHLLGTASGWGGLPETEAYYINVDPQLPVGEYTLTVGDVPVDGFWSISLYNAEGYFAENEAGAYSINNITGVPNEDGTITVRFGGDPRKPNTLPIMEGWNYLVRLYRPRPEVLDGTWTFPTIDSPVAVK
ncbi:DUF1214 domain-containing protein [Actinomyces minihominis]|uniref:DUF1214 domain-containing protein n=1 Tax=Actinomyces minihominis TaxID=2002838 RepID=UPI000C07464D|nr:DUF1214 domain-containing protein [Actinomyces minihominis]